MTLTKFTLRLPNEIAHLAAETAARSGISRHEWITNLITDTLTRSDLDPDIVLGYIRLDRGEVDPEATCPQCDNPFGAGSVFISFTAGRTAPKTFGPICADCATTE